MANTLKFGNGEWYGKKDTILAYNSENNNFKPLPFDFSRASSGTVVNKAGLIETVGSGEPRIDYKDDVNGALKLEPQRTNLLTYSEDFSNATWTKSGASVTSGFISPDGTLNADKLIATSVSGIHQTKEVLTAVSGDYTFSVFAKKGEYKNILVWDDALTGGIGVNLDDLSVFRDASNQGYKIEDYGSGWIRISVNYTYTAQAPQVGVYIYDNSVTPQISFVGNDVDGLYIFGTQLEEGSYATSYIPTQGSTVTRLADVCSQTTPSGIIGQTEGTVYWEINVKTTVATGNENILNIDDGAFGNTIYFMKSATGNLIGEMYASSVVQASFTKTGITEGIHKMAMAYANNNTAFFVDGVQVGVTDTSCTVPLMSRMQLGNGALGASDCLSNDLKLYNTRLTDSELQQLTTI